MPFDCPVEIPVTVAPVAKLQKAGQVQFVYGRVRRVVHAVGPERLHGPWWEGRSKSRDYFDAEDEQGERWWVFRVNETNRWYLHGTFD